MARWRMYLLGTPYRDLFARQVSFLGGLLASGCRVWHWFFRDMRGLSGALGNVRPTGLVEARV